MHYLIVAPTDLGARQLSPGVHEVGPAEAESILIRGTGRPATSAEIAADTAPAPAGVECAEARPQVETAAGSILTVRRRRAPVAAGAPAEIAAA